MWDTPARMAQYMYAKDEIVTRLRADPLGSSASPDPTNPKELVMNTESELGPASPRRWTTRWVVVAIIGGLAVLVPLTLYLVLVVSLGIPRHHPTVGEAQTATLSYYRAVQQHDYAAAYAYVAPHATTTIDGQPRVIDSADTLASIARPADQKNGAITGYTPTDGQFEPGKTIVDLTFQVTRVVGGVQDVHIQIALMNGRWRILRTDSV